MKKLGLASFIDKSFNCCVAAHMSFLLNCVFCHVAKNTTMSKMSRFLFIAFLTFIDRKGRGSFQASVLTSYVFRELGTYG